MSFKRLSIFPFSPAVLLPTIVYDFLIDFSFDLFPPLPLLTTLFLDFPSFSFFGKSSEEGNLLLDTSTCSWSSILKNYSLICLHDKICSCTFCSLSQNSKQGFLHGDFCRDLHIYSILGSNVYSIHFFFSPHKSELWVFFQC